MSQLEDVEWCYVSTRYLWVYAPDLTRSKLVPRLSEGFAKVQKSVLKLPFRLWPRDETRKKLGIYKDRKP